MNFISIADAANAAGISTNMLNRKFRQHHGKQTRYGSDMTPGAYHHSRRMEK